MKEDYLWDRTGTADEEIEELEQLLGTLKYQPQQLEIPAGAIVRQKPFSFRPLAIAATIAILLLGAGLWRSLQKPSEFQATNSGNTSAPNQSLNSEKAIPISAPPLGELARESTRIAKVKTTNRVRHYSLTASARHSRHTTQTEPRLGANEVAEAQAAKEQLMLALRVVSAKLTVAQKRTQGANPANQIQNQHKIG